MNREIKFRGKRVDNDQWVYGMLYQYQSKLIISTEIIEPQTHSDPAGAWIYNENEVHPETVGQYTGLKDKDGNEIYEGDLITIGPHDDIVQHLDGKPVLYEVKTNNCDYILYRNDLKLQWGRLSRVEELLWLIHFVNSNIHDNPELIK